MPFSLWTRQFAAWLKTIQRQIGQIRQEKFFLEKLRQFQNRLVNLAKLVRGVFTRSNARSTEGKVSYIGKSVFIKGDIAGDEDLIIDGQLEGKIEMKEHNLVVGPNSLTKAQINAKNVLVMGKVVGNICASKWVEIKSQGSVMGDITSLRISTELGARCKGTVDIQSQQDSSGDLSPANPETVPVLPGQLPAKLT
jgi:cytoskeletal protein CcmA (bactofilin family)